jgi:SAM-dependent methyltransferase
MCDRLWSFIVKGRYEADAVNVHIHQFAPGGAVVDAGAMEEFRTQWAAYQKLVDSDVLCHTEVGTLLHDALATKFDRPFSFLDIACGDASQTKRALAGTPVRHFHGIDLAEPAIDLAAANLADVPYLVDLDHRDFVEAMADRPEHADAVWCGLSIHHLATDDKLALMREIRSATGTGGLFMIYEPTLPEGEDRAGFLKRFRETVFVQWTMLTDAERDAIWTHIETYDLPESASGWTALGKAAGFAGAERVFADPSGLLGVFRYEA